MDHNNKCNVAMWVECSDVYASSTKHGALHTGKCTRDKWNSNALLLDFSKYVILSIVEILYQGFDTKKSEIHSKK
jgi:hypothetical protein